LLKSREAAQQREENTKIDCLFQKLDNDSSGFVNLNDVELFIKSYKRPGADGQLSSDALKVGGVGKSRKSLKPVKQVAGSKGAPPAVVNAADALTLGNI